MSAEREQLVTAMDDLKEKIIKLIDECERLEKENEELRSARRKAEEEVWAVKEELKTKTEELQTELDSVNSQLEEAKGTIESQKSEIDEATKTIESLKSEIETLKSELEEAKKSSESAFEEITRERDELRAELDEINSKLQRVSELYRETAAEKAKLEEKVDVSDLLAIYIMLIETVFYGKPHARILYTLHNTKKPITRRNIASSTGIQPAVVQKAIFDLVNAGLVSYDEETQEARLIKEIM